MKVDAGIFHDFHQAWIIELRLALNNGILPEGYYALADRVTRPFGPDVLTLPEDGAPHNGRANGGPTAIAVLDHPPKVRVVQQSEAALYAKKADRLAIRHASDDRIIAIIEIVSPGNKSSQHAIDALLEKVWSAIDQGIHVLLVELFPPTARDPQGIHGLIWGDAAIAMPSDERLTLVAYCASQPCTAYMEPTAAGMALIDMPLILDDRIYVAVPLEPTYQAAWRGVPRRWKTVLET